MVPRSLTVFFSLLIFQAAKAEFNFETFQNRNSPDFMFLDSSIDQTDKEHPISFLNTVTLQYHNNPIYFDQGEDGLGSLVSSIQSLNFAAEYLGWKNYSLGLEASVHRLSYHTQGRKIALGDARLFSKIHLWGARADWLGKVYFVPSITFPTGDGKLLLSNKNGGGGGHLVIEKNMGSILAVANLGIDYFSGASYQNLDYETQTYAGLGAQYQFSEKWGGSLEWMGRQIKDVRIGDLYAGAQYNFSKGTQLRGGGSFASTQTDSADFEYRILLGLSWAPMTEVITEHTNTIEKIKTMSDCRPKMYKKSILARKISEKEKSDLVSGRKLPYMSNSNYILPLLNPGQTSKGSALVLFAVDIEGLPDQTDVVAVKKMNLVLEARQAKGDNTGHDDTICLIHEKICSGNLTHEEKLSSNINVDFFKGKEPPNDYFPRQVINMHKTNGKITLPLSRMVENSTLSNPISLIYTRTLYFSVFTTVPIQKTIKLEIEINANSCTETQEATNEKK